MRCVNIQQTRQLHCVSSRHPNQRRSICCGENRNILFIVKQHGVRFLHPLVVMYLLKLLFFLLIPCVAPKQDKKGFFSLGSNKRNFKRKRWIYFWISTRSKFDKKKLIIFPVSVSVKLKVVASDPISRKRQRMTAHHKLFIFIKSIQPTSLY